MAVSIAEIASRLPYGDGSNKIFGMENFGNTCYCNSILQCLYNSEKFRLNLLSHHLTEHDRKLFLHGIKVHNFSNKYELLVNKRTKEQQKNPQPEKSDDRPKTSKKGSIFGLKFSSNNVNGTSVYSENDIPNKRSFIVEAKDCEFLALNQRLRILKNADFRDIQFMVTRPSQSTELPAIKNDSSQSSSMLLDNGPSNAQDTRDEGVISKQSSFIIVGIPYPETFLQNPINPFNPSPTADQRKRSALINGPIINLDHSLQLPSEQSDEAALLYALKDMFECMVENKSQIGVVSPTHFITRLKEKNFLFRQNNMHHDAHEFFNYLINEIIECLNKEVGPENNWCNQLFQGLITNETKCLSCETITSTEESFLDLSIDIPSNNNPNSLSYSLNNFSRSEILTHQNKFYCNTCSSLQEATKTIKVKYLPEILVINLKRFKYDDNLDRMVKLFDSISYSFKLRLLNTTGDKKDEDNGNDFTLYELYALVVHIGGGPMHGHYVSLCKIRANVWLLFDDETVEMVSDSYVMRFFGNGPGLASAYILFYQKCDTVDGDEDQPIDYGFNVSNIYHGEDYTLVSSSTSRHDSNETSSIPSARKTSSISSNKTNAIHEAEKEKSKTPSLDGIHVAPVTPPFDPNNSPSLHPTKKAGLFKKNFRLDNSTNLSASSFSAPANAATAASTENGTSAQPVPPPLRDKKSWVGGLKRREAKVQPEAQPASSRHGSMSSLGVSASNASGSGPEKERRRSIFGFKRKS